MHLPSAQQCSFPELSGIFGSNGEELTNILLEASHEVDNADVEDGLSKDEDELHRCLHTNHHGIQADNTIECS